MKPQGIEWNCDWEVRTSTFSKYWVGEVRIPVKSLGVEMISDRTTWGFNICRNVPVAKENSCWSPMNKRFHDPLLFGEIGFE